MFVRNSKVVFGLSIGGEAIGTLSRQLGEMSNQGRGGPSTHQVIGDTGSTFFLIGCVKLLQCRCGLLMKPRTPDSRECFIEVSLQQRMPERIGDRGVVLFLGDYPCLERFFNSSKQPL